MTIENRRQWEHTGVKLKELEELHERKRREPGDAHVRELTLRSLKKRINRSRKRWLVSRRRSVRRYRRAEQVTRSNLECAP